MNDFIEIVGIIFFIVLSFVNLIFIALTGSKIMKINPEEHKLLYELNFWTKLADLKKQIMNIYIKNKRPEEEGKKNATLILRFIGLFVVHFLIGFTGFLFWSISIISTLYLSFNAKVETDTLPLLIALLLIMLFIWFMFYIEPLSSFMGWDKFKNKIDRTLNLFFQFINGFTNKILYVFGEIIGFFLLTLYVIFIKNSYYIYLTKYTSSINPLVWYTLLIIVYQYFFSKYISKIIHKFYIGEYKDADLIFTNRLYTNSNSFSMIILILFCYMLVNSDQVLINSLTVIFLIDAYLIIRKNIIEDYKNNHIN